MKRDPKPRMHSKRKKDIPPTNSSTDLVRLNKYIANAGVCSRRDADKLIEQGHITVNGKKITELTPTRGFAAELAAAITIVMASRLGIPVSTTHILVGSVLGVGLARGIGALDLRVVGKIFASWLLTLPIAGVLSIYFFYFFKGLFAP